MGTNKYSGEDVIYVMRSKTCYVAVFLHAPEQVFTVVTIRDIVELVLEGSLLGIPITTDFQERIKEKWIKLGTVNFIKGLYLINPHLTLHTYFDHPELLEQGDWGIVSL